MTHDDAIKQLETMLDLEQILRDRRTDEYLKAQTHKEGCRRAVESSNNRITALQLTIATMRKQ